MKWLNGLITFLVITSATTAWSMKEVVVLVPGFFNSFTPEYFSKDIQKAFTQAGFKVYVATGLNPIGTIEDNGARLESILEQIEKIENDKVQFQMVTHSMGGFYSMWVANKQKFEISNILTVSTPYKGIEFVQEWRERSHIFKAITDLAFLEGLKETTQEGVQNFLRSIRLSPKTKVFAFAGYQDKSLDITDARHISVPLRVTSHYIKGPSDGIVGFESALAINHLLTTEGRSALMFRDPKFVLALEHWEQVLDRKSFLLLGIRNTGYIQKEQVRFYSGLAQVLKNSKSH